MNKKLAVYDEYTLEVFEKLRIKDDIEDPDLISKIQKDFDHNCILYCPKKKKIFREIRKDGTPIFTEKYKYAKIMRVDEAYHMRSKIIDYAHDNPKKKYINEICKSNSKNEFDLINCNLHVCIIKFGE